MTPTELTESLTLALKLKAEVELVCGLLDEKDARIAELETELHPLKTATAQAWSTLTGWDPGRLGGRTVQGADDPPRALQDAARLAKARIRTLEADDKDNRDRIAALESELAAKGREVEEVQIERRIIDRELTEARKSYCKAADERASANLDRDRERSRREALEREVRELAECADGLVTVTRIHRREKTWPGAACEGWLARTERTLESLHAILDRSAEQDEPHTPDAEPECTHPRRGGRCDVPGCPRHEPTPPARGGGVHIQKGTELNSERGAAPDMF